MIKKILSLFTGKVSREGLDESNFTPDPLGLSSIAHRPNDLNINTIKNRYFTESEASLLHKQGYNFEYVGSSCSEAERIGKKYNKEQHMPRDPVYYRLIIHNGKVTVVCMQSFDEIDYDQNRFIKDEYGDPYRFDTEEEAIAALHKLVKPEMIDPKYGALDQSIYLK